MRVIDFIDVDSLRDANLSFTYSIADHVTKMLVKRGILNVSLSDDKIIFEEKPVVIRGVEQLDTFNSDVKVSAVRDGEYVRFVVDGLDIHDFDLNCKKQYFPL